MEREGGEEEGDGRVRRRGRESFTAQHWNKAPKDVWQDSDAPPPRPTPVKETRGGGRRGSTRKGWKHCRLRVLLKTQPLKEGSFDCTEIGDDR